MLLLDVKNLSKRYSKKSDYTISNINLKCNGGEIVGLLGHNGAGKSTTIKCLTGIHPYDQGTIKICGYDLKLDSINAKKNFGYVSDEFSLFEKMTGFEFINFMADMYNVSSEERQIRIKELQSLFMLGDAIYDSISSYSHGMKQKISVIAALVHNPKLWVLDEPLTGLDPQSSYQLKKVMKQHAQEGNTVFFSSHILDVVENLCDRCCIIKKGKLQGVYDIAELKAKGESLEEIFVSVIGEEDK